MSERALHRPQRARARPAAALVWPRSGGSADQRGFHGAGLALASAGRRGAGLRPRRLGRSAFNRPTLQVARSLLGKFLVRRRGARLHAALITEVEAYKGPHDRACHAYGGRRTARVAALYAEGGTAYVVLVYGLHWLLNVSTAGAGRPEGVLIRGILLDPAGERRWISGPGRVSRSLAVDRELAGVDLTASRELWIEDRGVRIAAGRIRRGPRIGIDYAGPYWAARPWRFWIDAADGEPSPGRRDGRTRALRAPYGAP